jgi:hypothetical protein
LYDEPLANDRTPKVHVIEVVFYTIVDLYFNYSMADLGKTGCDYRVFGVGESEFEGPE